MRQRLAGASMGIAVVLATTGMALGAEPAATPGTGGDPRSPGPGPGLVGDPLFAIGAVLLVAVVSVVLTLAYVRMTDNRGGRPHP